MLKPISVTNNVSRNAKGQRVRSVLLITGLVLLAVWAAIWTISLKNNYLIIGKYTSIPCWPYLSCDFDINYYASRTWAEGGDPYQRLTKEIPFKYDHPPLALMLFSWCILVPHNHMAVMLWLCIQTFVFSLAVFTCWRSRIELNLVNIPFPLLLAAILFSFPVLFEMERGNWNMLVLFFLLLSVGALRHRTLSRDCLAGSCAGIAAWIKIYPALFFLGLLALRRWRAAAFFVVVVFLIGLADMRGTMAFAENIKASAGRQTPDLEGGFITWSHTVSGSWVLLCNNLHLNWLRYLPGTVGWGLLVFPLVLWVSYWVAKVPNPSRLLYPYFLWLIAAATYLPPIANDYSLFFLPLAALTVWDHRDKGWIHVLMVFLLIWWQPLRSPVSGKILYYCKLASLGSVALVLVIRAWEQIKVGPQNESEDNTERLCQVNWS